MNFDLKKTFLKKLGKNIKIFNACKTYICDICAGKKLPSEQLHVQSRH